jgi:hypothetical protein
MTQYQYQKEQIWESVQQDMQSSSQDDLISHLEEIGDTTVEPMIVHWVYSNPELLAQFVKENQPELVEDLYLERIRNLY